METNSWKTHDWCDRSIEIIPGEKITEFVCRKSFRAFIDDGTGRRYAIYTSTFRVDRLSDEVTDRWLSESCSNRRQTADQKAVQTRFAASTRPPVEGGGAP